MKADGKWYYLCIVMDLFSRKVIAWHISAKPDVELVISTFKKAYGKRYAPYGLMFHSNRKAQYTAFAFRQLLDALDVVQSISTKGSLIDPFIARFFIYITTTLSVIAEYKLLLVN
ncbi:DDE-type integrase/transposase/recombinase [Oscillospiraceae bacterium DSM 107454]|uniref:DDE-type integrase/transposase/recombinase n=1 Tax=Ructibacterium gallinarum TaxID=2779355 RepID=A0A9D5R837_9FIRM|nr:DDE-type integrase/transposase/recombinase [Ructibacterium gallinarum]MBE5039567.1 DDE-type integrase/transposase/recombinase [Ructibacterium gallinarum]